MESLSKSKEVLARVSFKLHATGAAESTDNDEYELTNKQIGYILDLL
jgi:hypothetical protein